MITTIAASLTLAAAVWGPAPCGTPTVVTYSDPSDTTAAVAFAVVAPYTPLPGEPPDLPACTIALNTGYIARFTNPLTRHSLTCKAIVHEWGHLTGHGHSSDWRNVMAAEGSLYDYWRCIRGTDRDALRSFRPRARSSNTSLNDRGRLAGRPHVTTNHRPPIGGDA